MPAYRGQQSIAALSTFVPDLRPNDRFAGRGGTVRIRSACLTGGAVGDLLQTVFIGNEMVENRGPLPVLANIDNFTPSLEETGLAAEVINITFINTHATLARTVLFFIEIQNAGM